MPITLYHRVINNVVVIINNGGKKPKPEEIYKAKINEKTHARRVIKNVRK